MINAPELQMLVYFPTLKNILKVLILLFINEQNFE